MARAGASVCCVVGAFFCFALSAVGVSVAHARGEIDSAELRVARPGAILRVWPLEGGAPAGARAYRVLYRSTGLQDEPIAVSGAIMFPTGPAPVGGRDIVAWAHPTTGVANHCAPSLEPGLAGTIPGLEEMLAQGHVIAATDYEGLGTPGIHAYLVGSSEARAVLDSVRAARSLPGTNASARFIVWGHSQGGHAALFTGELASIYAPELKLMGVAAAAPPTDLAAIFEADRDTTTGRMLTAMTVSSWSRIYRLPTGDVIAPAARQSYERVASDCIRSIGEYLTAVTDERPLERAFLAQNPVRLAQWSSIIKRNSASNGPIGAPMFIAQGTADDVVRPPITRQYVEQRCRAGESVTLVSMTGVSHMYAASASTVPTLDWMADRFAGKAVRNDCGRLR